MHANGERASHVCFEQEPLNRSSCLFSELPDAHPLMVAVKQNIVPALDTHFPTVLTSIVLTFFTASELQPDPFPYPRPECSDRYMTIFVQTPTGTTITLDVKRSYSIEDVMQQLLDEDKLGAEKPVAEKPVAFPGFNPRTVFTVELLDCSPDQQCLIFEGKQLELEEKRTLADYNIQNGSTLYLTAISHQDASDDAKNEVDGPQTNEKISASRLRMLQALGLDDDSFDKLENPHRLEMIWAYREKCNPAPPPVGKCYYYLICEMSFSLTNF